MKKTPAVNNTNPTLPANQIETQNIQATSANQSVNNFQPPLTRAAERVTKKPFGIYITPKTSPVQPEKFTGYHTGADAETTPAEANIDMPIYAIADGTVVFAGHVLGKEYIFGND